MFNSMASNPETLATQLFNSDHFPFLLHCLQEYSIQSQNERFNLGIVFVFDIWPCCIDCTAILPFGTGNILQSICLHYLPDNFKDRPWSFSLPKKLYHFLKMNGSKKGPANIRSLPARDKANTRPSHKAIIAPCPFGAPWLLFACLSFLPPFIF